MMKLMMGCVALIIPEYGGSPPGGAEWREGGAGEARARRGRRYKYSRVTFPYLDLALSEPPNSCMKRCPNSTYQASLLQMTPLVPENIQFVRGCKNTAFRVAAHLTWNCDATRPNAIRFTLRSEYASLKTSILPCLSPRVTVQFEPSLEAIWVSNRYCFQGKLTCPIIS